MKTQKVYIDGTSGHHMQYDAATDRQAAHVEAKVVSAQTIQHKSNSDGVLYGSDSDPASVSVTRSKELLRMAPRILSEIGDISRNLLELIDIRRRYIAVSSQRSADNPRNGTDWVEFRSFCGSECVYASSTAAVGPQAAGEESDVRQPGSCPCIEHDQPRLETDPAKFHLNDSGIYEISKDRNSGDASLDIPTLQDFYRDLSHMLAVSSNGPTKSFAYSRLEHLEGKFRMYTLENSHQEVLACKNVLHRDFYNVRKVDTHIHHSACMNQKHLLRFIKSKLRTSPNEVVLWKDGVSLTLSEVFASLRLTAYDLNIDTLDMHVSKENAC
jgi:AMP deaminase